MLIILSLVNSTSSVADGRIGGTFKETDCQDFRIACTLTSLVAEVKKFYPVKTVASVRVMSISRVFVVLDVIHMNTVITITITIILGVSECITYFEVLFSIVFYDFVLLI